MIYSNSTLQKAFSANESHLTPLGNSVRDIKVEDAIESNESLREEMIENEVNDMLYEDSLADYKESIN